MKQEDSYEAPVVRDLEELGLKGQFPLGVDTCTVGTETCSAGAGNTCGAGTGNLNMCYPGAG
jgi:hypothetical protein